MIFTLPTHPLLLVGLFVAGAAGWTVAEYLLHRFRGHSRTGRSTFRREHLAHHNTPGYFTPTPMKARLASPPLLALTALSVLLLGPAPGLAFGLGFIACYVSYELVHRRIHTHPPRGPVTRFLRLHHLHHHFHDPRMNHGVTSALWDRVFRTRREAAPINVPRRLIPPWMDDGEGELLPQYAGDYRLIGRKPGERQARAGQRAS